MTAAGVDPEDRKLITLARAAQVRSSATEGAAVRDTDGRTYAAATVDLPSLRISALQLAVAMAVSGAARGLEAAAVTGSDRVSPDDVAAVRDAGGSGLSILAADDRGAVASVSNT